MIGDYYYTLAKRRAENVPSQVRATPTARDLTLSHLSRKAMAQEGARAASESAHVRAEGIGMENRLLQDRMDYEQNQLGLAAGISLANMGLTGYKEHQALEHQKKIDAQREQYMQRMEQVQERIARMIEDRTKMLRGWPQGFLNFDKFADTAL